MTRSQKLLERLLSGFADRNFRFDDLCLVLTRFGFDLRVRGSHRIFTRKDVPDILNLQPRGGGEAKPYQVRQVRELIVRCHLLMPDSLDETIDADT